MARGPKSAAGRGVFPGVLLVTPAPIATLFGVGGPRTDPPPARLRRFAPLQVLPCAQRMAHDWWVPPWAGPRRPGAPAGGAGAAARRRARARGASAGICRHAARRPGSRARSARAMLLPYTLQRRAGRGRRSAAARRGWAVPSQVMGMGSSAHAASGRRPRDLRIARRRPAPPRPASPALPIFAGSSARSSTLGRARGAAPWTPTSERRCRRPPAGAPPPRPGARASACRPRPRRGCRPRRPPPMRPGGPLPSSPSQPPTPPTPPPPQPCAARRYSAEMCPHARRGDACPTGDACRYAHNVFELWM